MLPVETGQGLDKDLSKSCNQRTNKCFSVGSHLSGVAFHSLIFPSHQSPAGWVISLWFPNKNSRFFFVPDLLLKHHILQAMKLNAIHNFSLELSLCFPISLIVLRQCINPLLPPLSWWMLNLGSSQSELAGTCRSDL